MLWATVTSLWAVTVGLSVVVVVLSWRLVCTVFAYAALGVGMSCAVPDVQITDTSTRTVALGHALLSYLFGTVLVAVAVSLITDLG